jgi:hypothetical protein
VAITDRSRVSNLQPASRPEAPHRLSFRFYGAFPRPAS